MELSPKARFLSPGTADVLGQMILCVGACPMHCRVCSSVPGLDRPWVGRGGAELPLFENHCLKQ